jgi:hypothetical protein
MFNRWVSSLLHGAGGPPCFQAYGQARAESVWRVVGVYASHRRSSTSRWPAFGWRGTCTTWTASVVAVGWDFAESVLREQLLCPASRERPLEVGGGRLRDSERRMAAGATPYPSASELLAHELGHTWQAIRLGWGYLPLVGSLTLFREGPHFWNHFENQASEQGLFGGIVEGSISDKIKSRIHSPMAT